jgi:hypothetical protein
MDIIAWIRLPENIEIIRALEENVLILLQEEHHAVGNAKAASATPVRQMDKVVPIPQCPQENAAVDFAIHPVNAAHV